MTHLPWMLLLLAPSAAAGPLSPGTSSASSTTPSATEAVEVGDAAALIVLGVSEDVDRPSSASDLAVSLGGAFEDGKFPTSYAVEASPFWLSSASNQLSLYDHARGGFPSVWRNANASLAVANDATDGTRLAVAARTTYWGPPGKKSVNQTGKFVNNYEALFKDHAPGAMTVTEKDGECLQSLAQLSRFSAEVASRIDKKVEKDAGIQKKKTEQFEALSAVNTACAGIDPSTPKTAELCKNAGFDVASEPKGAVDPARDDVTRTAIQASLDAWTKARDRYDAALKTAATAVLTELRRDPTKIEGEIGQYLVDEGYDEAFTGCDDLLTRRQGFMLDMAVGFGFASPDDTIVAFEPEVFRAWAAPGWILGKWSLFFLGRYTLDGLDDSPSSAVDAGIGGGYLWPALGLSAQASVRPPLLGAELAARATLSTDIRIGKGIWFATSVGFTFPFDEAGSFVTLAGIKLGASQERTLATATADDLATLIPTP